MDKISESELECSINAVKKEETDTEVIDLTRKDYKQLLPRTCKYCKKEFTTRSYYLRHQRVGCPIFLKGTKHVCDICKTSYSSADGLKNHKKAFHEETLIPCQYCGKKLRKAYLEKHVKMHEEPDHECDLCGRKIRLNGLKSHQKSSVCISMQFIRKRQKAAQEAEEVQIIENPDECEELQSEIKVEDHEIDV